VSISLIHEKAADLIADCFLVNKLPNTVKAPDTELFRRWQFTIAELTTTDFTIGRSKDISAFRRSWQQISN